ncbi:hypothetical protein E2C01_097041 [Portunus trituberculatus]|uniref:Uncharacterized protein n=1 Tax=Portunus trituberculatus TaxID=210409 RepID=A0A5B7K8X0_PORTR|nr:hypothetical protein [Portunus trituberculatus]
MKSTSGQRGGWVRSCVSVKVWEAAVKKVTASTCVQADDLRQPRAGEEEEEEEEEEVVMVVVVVSAEEKAEDWKSLAPPP